MKNEKETHHKIKSFQADLASYIAKHGKGTLRKRINCASHQLDKFATGECLPRVDTYYRILDLINE